MSGERGGAVRLEILAANLEAFPGAYQMGRHDASVCQRAAAHLRALASPPTRPGLRAGVTATVIGMTSRCRRLTRLLESGEVEPSRAEYTQGLRDGLRDAVRLLGDLLDHPAAQEGAAEARHIENGDVYRIVGPAKHKPGKGQEWQDTVWYVNAAGERFSRTPENFEEAFERLGGDPIIQAQHEDTGRMWQGPRSQLPDRFHEVPAAPSRPADLSPPAVPGEHPGGEG